jgi:hypothetical protein
VTAKVFDLGTYPFLKHEVWVAAARKPTPGWIVFDGDIHGETRLCLLPTIVSSQGSYCIVIEDIGTREGMTAYQRVGFVRVSLKGEFGNSSWVVPDLATWPEKDVQSFLLF